jgi:type VI secretion system secreted protein Hcp
MITMPSTAPTALSGKSTTHRTLLVLGFMALSSVFSAQAALDMFINFGPNIKGESRDKVQGPKGDCDILSWGWGMSQTGTTHTGGGGGAGKANFQDITLTKYVDAASPGLMTALAKGSHLPKVVLLTRKAGEGQQKYIEITMEEVIVTSLTNGGSGGEDRLTERVSLNFAKVKFAYTPQDSKGTVTADKVFAWNIAENTMASKPVEVKGEPGAASPDVIVPVSDASLRNFVHAGTADQLKAHEEVRAGKRYLAVEVTRPKNTTGVTITAQTSADAHTWSSEAVLEEVAEEGVDTQTTRYVIPIDQAQKFFRTATE